MLHLHIHPENPQARLITQAVERIRAGDVVVYPTDAAYAIGCQIGNKSAMVGLHKFAAWAQSINTRLCVVIYPTLPPMPKLIMQCIDC